MLTRLAGTAVVVGCSYPPLPPPDGCWPQWREHRVAIDPATVSELTELSGPGEERNPWRSDDGLRLYFTRVPGPQATGDVYLASRGATTEGFGVPAPVVNLNSPAHEHRAALTPDEQLLVLSTERSGALDIVMVARPPGQAFGTPDDAHLHEVNATGVERFDPFLSADGLRLYLSTYEGPAGAVQQLLIATRGSATGDFATPSLVPGIDPATDKTDPVLSRDERVIVFREGDGADELWYATRPDPGAAFGAATQLPGVNAASTVDAALTPDGCELYFASTRRDGKYHLFHAQVAP